MPQIEVENNTPYRRRIFLHPLKLSPAEPIPLLLAAWRHLDLAPGERAGASLGAIRIGVRAATGATIDHRTVSADVQYQDRVTFQLTNNIPTLSVEHNGGSAFITIYNSLNVPALMTLFQDTSPFVTIEVPPHFNVAYNLSNQLFAYASTPIADDSAALIIEPATGQFTLAGSTVQLKLSPDGASVQWSS